MREIDIGGQVLTGEAFRYPLPGILIKAIGKDLDENADLLPVEFGASNDTIDLDGQSMDQLGLDFNTYFLAGTQGHSGHFVWGHTLIPPAKLPPEHYIGYPTSARANMDQFVAKGFFYGRGPSAAIGKPIFIMMRDYPESHPFKASIEGLGVQVEPRMRKGYQRVRKAIVTNLAIDSNVKNVDTWGRAGWSEIAKAISANNIEGFSDIAAEDIAPEDRGDENAPKTKKKRRRTRRRYPTECLIKGCVGMRKAVEGHNGDPAYVLAKAALHLVRDHNQTWREAMDCIATHIKGAGE